LKSPSFFGSSAAEFFWGIPTTAVAPVDDAITPILSCAVAHAEASASATVSEQRMAVMMCFP
jgi:hypothetical protein